MKQIPGFRPLEDVELAAWVRESLMPPGNGEPFPGGTHCPTGAFIPPIYEAYARIIDREGGGGTLNAPRLGVLAETLSRFTSTPEDCYFCVWEGLGTWWPSEPMRLMSEQQAQRRLKRLQRGRQPIGWRWRGPTREQRMERETMDAIPKAEFPLGHRRYLLFGGPCRTVETFTDVETGVGTSPNIWWPEDRAWCVFTEIDSFATDLGGSRECVTAVLADPSLEAEPLEITDPPGPSPFDELHGR